MSEKEVKTCPKCSGEMERAGHLAAYLYNVRLSPRLFGEEVIPFCCKKCRYIELYKGQ